MNSGYKRGLLIVFEGMDRVGKSTQCELLAEYFKNIRKENVERINFPGNKLIKIRYKSTFIFSKILILLRYT